MVLTISGFRITLNHEDPEFVIGGLKDFNKQVLLDHDAFDSFGHHGRCNSFEVERILSPDSITATTGLLSDLILSSPQLEELFVLWDIPSRNEDKLLCSVHMTTFAVIFHCCQRNQITFGNKIASRILHDFTKSIFLQLATGHIELVHATLGLLIAISRTSHQNARDVYQKIIANASSIESLTQRGKMLPWSDLNGEKKMSTDCRYLLIILILSILQAADDELLKDIFANNSIMRKVIGTINKDNKHGMKLLIEGLQFVQRDKYYLLTNIKHPIIDYTFQNKLFLLYRYEDSNIKTVVHEFVLDYSRNLAEVLQLGKKHSSNNFARQMALQLIKHLMGHQNLKHREIQMVLLKAQPNLLSAFIDTIETTSWDPQPTFAFISSLHQLTYLINNVSLDHQQRSIIKSAILNQDKTHDQTQTQSVAKSEENREHKIREVIDAIVTSIIPSGMTKKDLIKLLTQSNHLVLTLGLSFLQALISRMSGIFGEAISLKTPSFQTYFNSVFSKIIPEFHYFLSLRVRLLKLIGDLSLSKSSEAAIEREDIFPEASKQQKQETSVSDDLMILTQYDDNETDILIGAHSEGIDIEELLHNHDDSDVATTSITSPENSLELRRRKLSGLLNQVLQVIGAYIDIVPNAALESNFDFIKLIDEVIPWEITVNPDVAARSFIATGDMNLCKLTLNLIFKSVKAHQGNCKWFGSKDEAVKLITNLIVMNDWRKVVKRSPLSKIILLASLGKSHISETQDLADIILIAKDLLHLIFWRSGMFDGHGLVSLELASELASWINALCITDGSVLLMDAVLKISHHWNLPLCFGAADVHVNKSYLASFSNIVKVLSATTNSNFDNIKPISPVLYCAIKFSESCFDFVESELPNHIKSRISSRLTKTVENINVTSDSNSSDFFSKYDFGFRIDLQNFLKRVILQTCSSVRGKISYCQQLIPIFGKTVDNVGVSSLYQQFKQFHTVDSSNFLKSANIESFEFIRELNKLLQTLNIPIRETGDVVELMDSEDSSSLLTDDVIHFSISMLSYFDDCLPPLVQHLTSPESILNHSTGDTNDNNNYVLSYFIENWSFFTSINLQCKTPVSSDMFDFIKINVAREIAVFNSDTESYIVVPFITKYMSILLQILTKLPACSVSNKVVSKGKQDFVTKSCSYLTSIIISIIGIVPCDHMICSALHIENIEDLILEDDSAGQYLRHILCAAASSYFFHFYQTKNSRHQSELNARNRIPLWSALKSSLILHNQTNQTWSNNLFALGWILQKFIDDYELRSLFIGMALNTPDGYTMLDFSGKEYHSLKQPNYHIQSVQASAENLTESSLGFLHSNQFIPLDPISSSVLASCSVESILTIIPTFLNSSQTSSKLCKSNALICTSINISKHGTHSNGLLLISHYVNPLSLVSLSFNVDSLKHQQDSHHIFHNSPRIHEIVSDGSLLHSQLAESLKTSEQNNIDELVLYLLGASVPLFLNSPFVPISEKLDSLNSEWETGAALKSANEEMRSTLLKQLLCVEGEDSDDDLLVDVLYHSLIINGNFFANILTLLARTDASHRRKFVDEELTMFTVIHSLSICCCNQDSSPQVSLLNSWLKLFSSLSLEVLDGAISSISENSSITASKITSLKRNFIHLKIVFGIPFPTDLHGSLVNKYQDKLKKKLSKFSKLCLKFLVDQSNNLLEDFVDLIFNINRPNSTGFYVFGTFDEDNVSHPQTLLRFLISHSKFITALCGNVLSSLPNTINISLLRVILILMGNTCTTLQKKAVVPVDEHFISAEDKLLFHTLCSIYFGTMSEADRIILRILYLMETSNRCPALCTIRPSKFVSKEHSTGAGGGHWITSLSIPNVYATLHEFPQWRSLIPQPFICEGYSGEHVFKKDMRTRLTNLAKEWSNNPNGGSNDAEGMKNELERDIDDDNASESNMAAGESSDSDGSSGSESGEEDDDENMEPVQDDEFDGHHSNFDDESMYLTRDLLLHCSDKVYDPTFWLPVMHYRLHESEISIRQFANCGGLSFVISSLSSSCPLLRTYSMSCMNRIFDLIRLQTPQHDAAFKERPQLMILLNFLRNAFSEDSNNQMVLNLQNIGSTSNNNTRDPLAVGAEFPIPSSIALFMGRSTMHLLQPGHELYSKISKYLLSRPWCDAKDLPLFESVIIEADSQNEVSERLSALRIIRDNLNTKQDHLNMCRKNAYSHLMLLFSVFARDSRMGHAVLDIFDKALSIKAASRYLIERCNFLPWLHQIASASSSLQLLIGGGIGVETQDLSTGLGESNTVCLQSLPSSFSDLLLAAPPSLLPRALQLLRKTVGASFLLSSEGLLPAYQIQVMPILTSLANEVVDIHRGGMAYKIPNEYYKQIVMCMWDWTILSHSLNCDNETLNSPWEIDLLVNLVEAVDEGFKPTQKSDKVDLSLSLLCLIGQTSSTSCGGSPREIEVLKKASLLLMHSTNQILIGVENLELLLGKDIAIVNPINAKASSKGHNTESANLTQCFQNSYFTIQNLLSGDGHLPISPQFKSSHPLLELSPHSHGKEVSLNGLFHQTWSIFSNINWETIQLPISLGINSIISLCCKSMIVIAVNSAKTVDSMVTLPGFEILRWSQCIHTIFFLPQTSELLNISVSMASSGWGRNIIGNQILASFDRNPSSKYTNEQSELLLLFRLTMISLISFSNCNNNFAEIFDLELLEYLNACITGVIQTFSGIKNAEDVSSRGIVSVDLAKIDTNLSFWLDRSNAYELMTLRNICFMCSDLMSVLLSLHDRACNLNKTSEMNHDIVLCKESIFKSIGMLISTNGSLNKCIDDGKVELAEYSIRTTFIVPNNIFKDEGGRGSSNVKFAVPRESRKRWLSRDVIDSKITSSMNDARKTYFNSRGNILVDSIGDSADMELETEPASSLSLRMLDNNADLSDDDDADDPISLGLRKRVISAVEPQTLSTQISKKRSLRKFN